MDQVGLVLQIDQMPLSPRLPQRRLSSFHNGKWLINRVTVENSHREHPHSVNIQNPKFVLKILEKLFKLQTIVRSIVLCRQLVLQKRRNQVIQSNVLFIQYKGRYLMHYVQIGVSKFPILFHLYHQIKYYWDT